MSTRKTIAAIAGAGVVALVVSACGSSGGSGAEGAGSTPVGSSAPSQASGGSSAGESTPESSGSGSSAPESGSSAGSSASGSESSGSTSGSGSSQEASVKGDDDTWCDTIKKNWPNIKGKTVEMYSSITGDEATSLRETMKDFNKCTGATIKFNSDKSFEKQVVIKAKSGNPPDLAVVPQPGLLQTLVSTGTTVAAPDQVKANVKKYWDSGWEKYGTVNGKFYAAPLGANVKSLVWYSPKMFKKAGYEVPKTWDDMMKLTKKIASSGDVKPWCAGIESGDATGWPATDWLEEVVLRQAGPDVYDDWVAGKVKFTDPPIKKALKTVGDILKNPKYVNGGFGNVSSIATTAFDSAGVPILKGKCYMMQMANFYTWPDGTKVGKDGDVYAFYEPPMGDKFGDPVEVGGEFIVAFNKKPAVQAAQFYLSTAHWANLQSQDSPTRVSANKGLKVSSVQGPINKLSVQILQNPKAVSRFDASDMMPASVGSGAEWQQLTAWITGQDDATTLKAIQAAWPKS